MASSITIPASSEESRFSSVSSFITSFFPVAYAEEESSEDDKEESGESEESDDKEESGDDEEEEEEEDEDEPEDPLPAILEDCENSKACAAVKHHFDDCAKRVNEGKGYEGENCIEEFFHFSHCAQDCAAPKLFHKLV